MSPSDEPDWCNRDLSCDLHVYTGLIRALIHPAHLKRQCTRDWKQTKKGTPSWPSDVLVWKEKSNVFTRRADTTSSWIDWVPAELPIKEGDLPLAVSQGRGISKKETSTPKEVRALPVNHSDVFPLPQCLNCYWWSPSFFRRISEQLNLTVWHSRDSKEKGINNLRSTEQGDTVRLFENESSSIVN